ncbi:MAG TPA: hypothetical protein VGP82_19150 [Ktedonobacterales bacterium]|nr:hypothetical protein [Ktedonobacterales bacterium]
MDLGATHPLVPVYSGALPTLDRRAQGYRFKGTATVHQQWPIFEQGVALYRQRGTRSPIRSIVPVQVERAVPVISPAYDQGQTEEEIRASWLQYWNALNNRATANDDQAGGSESEHIRDS